MMVVDVINVDDVVDVVDVVVVDVNGWNPSPADSLTLKVQDFYGSFVTVVTITFY